LLKTANTEKKILKAVKGEKHRNKTKKNSPLFAKEFASQKIIE